MDNASSLLTVNYKLNSAESFISSIEDNQYYFFVGNHIGANNESRPFDNEQDTVVSSYHGMIFGKRIQSNDTSLMIRRINWESGTIYDIYDHRDALLYDRDFYVIVHEGTQWDVFKCLENGDGAPSTVVPSRTNVSSDGDDFYYPTDGYRWKFMYTISDANFDKFSTSTHVPVYVHANTSSQAVRGSIDSIVVTENGKDYGNYLNGSFGVSDIRLNGNPKRYGISVSNAKTTNGYYDACWLYVSSGAGAGQYRKVESYVSNATHNYVTLESQFDPSDEPQNGSIFEITPSVNIIGDGRETLPANARAIINTTGNTVARIEMIDRGQDYYHASAEVIASSSVGVSEEAGIVPIMSPIGGHGHDAPSELGAKFAGVTIKLIGTESNTIITNNDYSQIGILKNPQFREVELTLDNSNRDFFTNELVYKVTTAQLAGTIETNLDANSALTDTLTLTGANGHHIVSVGDSIVITDGTNNQLANVSSVGNTSISMDQVALWDTGSGTANIHLARTSSYGLVDGFATGTVTITNTYGEFETGDIVMGAETGTFAEVTGVSISGVEKGFSTFIQTYTYIGEMTQGTFTSDELVYQMDDEDVTARFHSTAPDPDTSTLRIYTTNQIGVFNTAADGGVISTDEIKGATSGAIASLTNKYLPDLVYGSGEVVYVEYGDSITRAEEKTETFKLVFAF
jgi:hypothetical protein